MKYLRKFDSVAAMEAASETTKVDFVGLAYDNGEAKMNIAVSVPLDPKSTPFYIDVRGAVTLSATSGLQMSTDETNWTDTVAGSLPTGKTYFRVASDQSSPLKPDWTENDSSDYDIGGNINSLVKVDFENDTTSYDFQQFFKSKAKLKSASNLVLPATTLTQNCYNQMFFGCTALTDAPELPATTLAYYCYASMFYGCTTLATAPALPATTLAHGCYRYMFKDCTSLTTAPALPATTLAEDCYSNIFYNCTSLTTAPALPATTLVDTCYSGMFKSCTSLTTAPELPATTLTKSCYGGMFIGCTSLTTAPALPATTLTEGCYYNMFLNCTNLNYIKCLATNKKASDCVYNWVSGVAASGTFVKNPSMASWTTGANGIPSGWTVQDA